MKLSDAGLNLDQIVGGIRLRFGEEGILGKKCFILDI